MYKRCLIFLFAAALLSGCSSGQSGRQRTISVTGLGTVIAEPDTAEIDVTVSHIATTAREAQEEVNTQMNRLLQLVDAAGIERSEVKTSALNISPEYDYSGGFQEYLGQKSELSVHITVNGIKTNPEKLSGFIYSVTEFDKIILRNISFDIKDKTAFYAESRELAYQKAFDKASQYASLAGGAIKETLRITEGNTGYTPFAAAQNTGFAFGERPEASMAAAYDQSLDIPSGSIEISSMVEAEFQLE